MQGFNMGRYRPPEALDASLTTEKSDRKSRLSTWEKPKQPTIRFETPCAIWCTTCPDTSSEQLIGQGRRFNAFKKSVGKYHSTTIWSFRFKHIPCGGWIEVRTDPKGAAADEGKKGAGWVVAEGAKKRDYGDDEEDDSGTLTIRPADREGGLTEERKRQREDAFELVEGRAAKKTELQDGSKRIKELRSVRERDWRDPDAANKRARDLFRVGRRDRQKNAKESAAIQEKYGLGFDIPEEKDTDRKMAGLTAFQSQKKEKLADILTRNTRARLDPWSTEGNSKPPPGRRKPLSSAGATLLKKAQVSDTLSDVWQ